MRVADKISSPETAGFVDKAIKPLHAQVVSPARRALAHARLGVEGSADRHRGSNGKVGAVFVHPYLLFGSAKGYEQEIGRGFGDELADLSALHWIALKSEGRAVSTDDGQGWITPPESNRSHGCGSRQASEKKDAKVMPRRLEAESLHEIASCYARGYIPSEDLRREHNRDAVGNIEGGGVEGFGEAGILLRQSNQLGIRAHDQKRLGGMALLKHLNDLG